MTTKSFLLRLLLDLLAAGMLLVALAYYWLDNTAHELIGTGIFLFILVHNVFNRRWWGKPAQPRPQPRRAIDLLLTLPLLAVMVLLLATSLMVSETVFQFLNLGGGFTARRVHAFTGYWSLILVAIHLGIRWQRVMLAVRNAFGFTGTSRARTAALRATGAAIALYGVYCSFEMDVGHKLSLQMSLDGWDFDASAPSFFVNWVSIAALYVFITHHVLRLAPRLKKQGAHTS
ncbi:MAG: DUF4405 domain-containing protein [Pseudomonadota bacterium]